MTTAATDKRPCAACGDTRYLYSATWNFVNGPACLCTKCHEAGYVFNGEGKVVKGLRGWLKDAMAPKERAS